MLHLLDVTVETVKGEVVSVNLAKTNLNLNLEKLQRISNKI